MKKLLFIIVLSFNLLLPGINQAKVIFLNFTHIVAEDTPKGLAANYLKKLVEEKSQGRLRINVFPNMSQKGFDDTRAVMALQKGAVQLVCPSISKFTKSIPQLQLFDLPFLFESPKHFHAFTHSPKGQHLLTLLTQKGLTGLAYWDNGFKMLFNNKRPIKKPEDIKGLKFRVMPSEVLKAQFEVLGAQAIAMPYSKVYDALKDGTVDGFENTWSNFYSKQFYKVQKYITISEHGYLGYILTTSNKVLNTLPPDLKKIFLEAVKEATEYEINIAAKTNQQFLEKLKQVSGLHFTVLTPEDKKIWQKAMQPVYDQFSPIIGKEYIQAVQSIKEK